MPTINDFVSALRGAPTTLQSLDKQLAKLYAERAVLQKAPPHIADIQAWALKGLDTASQDYLGRLRRWHFNDAALAGWSGETLDGHNGPQLLGIHTSIPHGAGPAVGGGSPDLAALTHFLRPALEAQLPKLIAEAFPGARNGMPSAERRAKLAKVGEKIAALEAQRAELEQGVREVAKHLDAAKYAAENGATDADIAAEVAAFERETGEQILGVRQ